MITPAQRLIMLGAVLKTILEEVPEPSDGRPTEHPEDEDCHGLCGAEQCMRKAALEMGMEWPGEGGSEAQKAEQPSAAFPVSHDTPPLMLTECHFDGRGLRTETLVNVRPAVKPAPSEDPASYCCWANYMHADRHEPDCDSLSPPRKDR